MQVLELGWYLREFGGRWSQIQLIAAALEYCKDQQDGSVRQIEGVRLDEIRERQKALSEVVKGLKLEQIHQTKPILTGNQITELYEIKAGKILKSLIDETLSF